MLTQTPQPHRIIDFPRKKAGTEETVGQLAMMVLTQNQQMEAAAATEMLTRKLLKESPKADEARKGYDDLYSNAAAVELLWRACRRHDDLERPLFPTPIDIRQHLSPNEVSVLVQQYMIISSEVGPIVATMTDAEIDAWISRLVEGGSAAPLGLLTSDALTTLVLGLASRVYASTTAISSVGTPLDDGLKTSESVPEETATPE